MMQGAHMSIDYTWIQKVILKIFKGYPRSKFQSKRRILGLIIILIKAVKISVKTCPVRI